MARLLYAALASLDGYVADMHGRFDWAAPDEEVHTAVNDLLRPVGLNLYGRRMYEVLVAWETLDVSGEPPCIRDFAELWRGSEKIVYSRTLDGVRSERTRLERVFDPERVRELKARSSRDLAIGGPDLAASAVRAGLVDEWHLFFAPVIVGGGTSAFPRDVPVELELTAERRFASGFVQVSYRATGYSGDSRWS